MVTYTAMLQKIRRKVNQIAANHRFRREIRKGGGKIAHGVRIKIIGEATVGKRVVIGAKGIDIFDHSQIVVTSGAKLDIGNNVGMSSVSVFCKEKITIEDYVNIGAGSLLFDSNFHSTNWRVRENRVRDVAESVNSPVVIKHHAFIGTRCIIMKGVKIGARSIIAAGSVVCHDIPDDCIAGGNPCKVIKMLE